MSVIKREKIALGMITRHFDDPQPIVRFLENAMSYGHDVDRVIVAYSHSKEDTAIAAVRNLCRLELINAADPEGLRVELGQWGMAPDQIRQLVALQSDSPQDEISYGSYRNAVLFKALLDGVDYLLFFDTDVAPRVLTHLDDEDACWQEVDFVGTHMRSLRKPQVAATTSEYSGYYIIPPMSFPGLSELLHGLGKGMALEYMEDCQQHHCLNLAPENPGIPRPTDKPLGGNLGLDLRSPWRLAPFYSTIYTYGGKKVKGRGEDTLLGQTIATSSGNIIDIDLRIFHDTYDRFPKVPNIRRKPVRDRFYWACMGWIGRNPFLSWYLDRAQSLKTDWRSEMTIQRIGLEIGGEKAAQYLKDPRFQKLHLAFEASFEGLSQAIERYQHLMLGWDGLLNALGRDQPPAEEDELVLDDFPLAS